LSKAWTQEEYWFWWPPLSPDLTPLDIYIFFDVLNVKMYLFGRFVKGYATSRSASRQFSLRSVINSGNNPFRCVCLFVILQTGSPEAISDVTLEHRVRINQNDAIQINSKSEINYNVVIEIRAEYEILPSIA
jgi:hypothetical protein